jgi:hypothetical protein
MPQLMLELRQLRTAHYGDVKNRCRACEYSEPAAAHAKRGCVPRKDLHYRLDLVHFVIARYMIGDMGKRSLVNAAYAELPLYLSPQFLYHPTAIVIKE